MSQMSFVLGGYQRPSGRRVPIRATHDDLETHALVLGASRRGKSKLIEAWVRQLVRSGAGVSVLDPHGTLVEALVKWIAEEGWHAHRQIILFDPARSEWTPAFNPLHVPLADASPDHLAFFTESLYDVFATAWSDENYDTKPLLARFLSIFLHVLVVQRLTLVEAMNLLDTADTSGVRDLLLDGISDPYIRADWRAIEKSCNRLSDLEMMIQSTRNRLRKFLGTPLLRTVLGQTDKVLDYRKVMDDGAIMLANLSEQNVLHQASNDLLGSLLINDAFLRCRQRSAASRPHYLFIDEAHRYLVPSIAEMLDQTAKWGLHFILVGHRLGQFQRVSDDLLNAVLGQCQMRVVMGGLPYDDAMRMVNEMCNLDLDQPKPSSRRPVPVGNRIVTLHNGGTNESASRTTGTAESDSRSHTEGASVTDGVEVSSAVSRGVTQTKSIQEGVTEGFAHSVSEAQTDGVSSSEGIAETSGVARMRGDSETDGESGSRTIDRPGSEINAPALFLGLPTAFHDTTGQSSAHTTQEAVTDTLATTRQESYGRSTAVTRGTSDTVSSAVSRIEGESVASSESIQRGSSRSRSVGVQQSQTVGRTHTRSDSDTKGKGTSLGWSEASLTVYEERETDTRGLPEQQYRAAKFIQRLPKRHILVKFPDADHPVLLVSPTVREPEVPPETVETVVSAILEASPAALPRCEAEQLIADRHRELVKRAQEHRREVRRRRAVVEDSFAE